MKLKSKTKLFKNRNSMVTTVPTAIVQLLNLEKGNHIEWELNIDDNSGRKLLTINFENE